MDTLLSISLKWTNRLGQLEVVVVGYRRVPFRSDLGSIPALFGGSFGRRTCRAPLGSAEMGRVRYAGLVLQCQILNAAPR